MTPEQVTAAQVSAAEVLAVGQTLVAVAGVFRPESAAAVSLLLKAIAEANALVMKIRAQSAAEQQAVWTSVSTDFSSAVIAFEASVKATKPT